MARAVKSIANDKVPQQLFYDWGVGSDADPIAGGITGKGRHKNMMDAYRYIVQNYADGDDIPLAWMMTEASASGLSLEPHLKKQPEASTTATLHKSRRYCYRLRAKLSRPIEHGHRDVMMHRQVKQRCLADSGYRPDNLVSYIESDGWPAKLER